MNIPMALAFLRPGEEWILDGDTYEGLTWLSDTPKPTLSEIEAAYPAAQAAADQIAADKASALRKLAEASGLTAGELSAIGLAV